MLERTSVEHASQNINIEHLSLIEYSAKVFFLASLRILALSSTFVKLTYSSFMQFSNGVSKV